MYPKSKNVLCERGSSEVGAGDKVEQYMEGVSNILKCMTTTHCGANMLCGLVFQ